MNNNDLNYFKKKLLQERRNSLKVIKTYSDEKYSYLTEMSSELSLYDNHPGDSSGDIYELERNAALKGKEEAILNKIDMALEDVNNHSYGSCKACGRDIERERLESIPYARYCVSCQKEREQPKVLPMENRPVEEEVLGKPFGYGYDDYTDKVEFDSEDSYQAVEKFNRREEIVEYYEDDEDYVEPIEKISNEQYKNQLPD